jgi:hypothetical protein
LAVADNIARLDLETGCPLPGPNRVVDRPDPVGKGIYRRPLGKVSLLEVA